ncbi:MAG: double zinc ribbon domain-containing protein [Clostridiales bacterium]|jgi:predicted amidophosphoribosyltransferase|nr:double zinc ribbon domain-containing protein [Clostridiales bacterium]
MAVTAVLAEAARALLYPPRCVFCGEITRFARVFYDEENFSKYTCDSCGEPLEPLSASKTPLCAQCGAENAGAGERCPACARRETALSGNYALFLFERRPRRLVLALKDGERVEPLLRTVIKGCLDAGRFSGADFLAPVPPWEGRPDHAGLIARIVSDITGVPALAGVMERVLPPGADKIPEQKRTHPSKRFENALGTVFLAGRDKNLRKSEILAKGIFLIDDIYTTGGTMNACASVLLEAGAAWAKGFTVCAARE